MRDLRQRPAKFHAVGGLHRSGAGGEVAVLHDAREEARGEMPQEAGVRDRANLHKVADFV
jgi:hypothetical protein